MLLPRTFELKKEADEAYEIFISVLKFFFGSSAIDPLINLNILVKIFLISTQLSGGGSFLVRAVSRFYVGGSISKFVLADIGGLMGAPAGGIPGAAIGAGIGGTSAFLAAIAGAIYLGTLKIRELKRKGVVVDDGVSVILNYIFVGSDDLVPIREKLGKEAYDKLYNILKDDRIQLELGDIELQILNSLTNFIYSLFVDPEKAFHSIFSDYKKDFS